MKLTAQEHEFHARGLLAWAVEWEASGNHGAADACGLAAADHIAAAIDLSDRGQS